MPTLAGPDATQPDFDRAQLCRCADCYPLKPMPVGALVQHFHEHAECARCDGIVPFVALGGDSQGDPAVDDYRDVGERLLRAELAWVQRRLTTGYDPERRRVLITLRNLRESLGLAEPI